MSTVDDRIVGLKFDNSQFEQGLGTSLKSLNKLEKSLDLKGATKGITGVAQAFGRLGFDNVLRAADTVNQRLSAVGILGVTALSRIANQAIDTGAQLVKSLTIQPITAGFQEYELKMGSIQTILENTARHGTGLKEVTASLDELNEYADKTIYNFGDMTKNIGLFTNAGIGVEDATSMIKGFSNEAAASGTTAQGAAGAAYQLSQALSAGTIRLMDWRSLTNVGMGNKNMQSGIIEIAQAMGTFEGRSITAEQAAKDFNGSLEKGWLTADVMQNYLKIQAGELSVEQMKTLGLTEQQITAFQKQQKTSEEAATKVRTWTQLFGTLQESVGSGWAQTFDILLGDFDQATELFTSINNTIGPFVDGMSDARNELLQGWADLGGRTKALEAFASIFKFLGQVAAPIGAAFREVFEALTPKDLMSITESFKAFADGLRVTEKQADQIKRSFKGVFAIFSIAGQAIKALFSTIGGLIGALAPAGESFLEFTANIGDWLVGVDAAIKKGNVFAVVGQKIVSGFKMVVDALSSAAKGVSNFVGNVKTALIEFSGLDSEGLSSFSDSIREKLKPLTGIGGIFSGMGEAITKAWTVVGPALGKFAGKVGDFAGKVREAFDEFRESFDFEKALAIFNGGLFSVVLVKIISFFKGLKKTSEDSGSIKSAITDVISGLTDTLGELQNTLKAGTLILIAGAIALLAYSAVQLAKVDAAGLAKALTAITVMVGQLFGMMALFQKTMSAGGLTGMIGAAAGLVVFAAAIAILTTSVERLAKIPLGDLAKGLGAVLILMGSLAGVSSIMSKNSGSFLRAAIGLIPFAIAIKLLSDAVAELGGIDMGSLVKGLGGVLVLIAGMSAFLSNPKMGSIGIQTGAGLLLLAAGMKVLASAVTQLAALDLGSLAKGTGAITVLLGVLAGFTAVTGGAKGMVGVGVGMVAIGAAMLILSNALTSMGNLPLTTIGKGLLAMGGSLVIIAAAMKFMTSALPGALALLIIAPALLILGEALEKFGNLSMEEIGRSLIMLGGSLLVIAGSMYLMTSALPGAAALLVIAAALTILAPVLMTFANMSLEQIGTSLLMLVGVFAVLGVAGLVLAPVVPVLLGLGAAIMLLGAGVALAGVGVLALATGITALAAAGAAGAAGLTVALSSMIGLIPYFIQQVGVGFVAFMDVIANSFESIVNVLVTVLSALVEAIIQVIPQVVDAIVLLALALLEGFDEVAPKLIESAVQLIRDLLDAIVELVPALVDAGMRLITGILDGIASNIGGLVDAGTDVVVNFLNGIANSMGRVGEAATNVVESFVTTLVDSIIAAKSHIESEAKRLLDAMFGGAFKAVAEGVGKVPGEIGKFIQSIVTALSGGASNLYNEATSVAGNIIRGMVNGIRNGISSVTAAARGMAQKALDAAKNLLGIRSPSREFIKIGEFVRKGFLIGIASGKKNDVIDAYNDMASQLQKIIDNAKTDTAAANEKLKKLKLSYDKLASAKKKDTAAMKENKRQQQILINQIRELGAESYNAGQALVRMRTSSTWGVKDEFDALIKLTYQTQALTAKIKDATEAYKDAIKTRDDYNASIKAQYSALAAIPTKNEYEEYANSVAEGVKGLKSPLKEYQSQMRQQIEDTNTFSAKLQQLRKLGLNDTMYKKLLESGTDSLPFVSELLKGGAGAVRDVNTLSKDIDLAASKLGNTASKSLYQAGVDAARGLVEGLQKQKTNLDKVAKALADSMVASLKTALKIKSPSRVMAEIGRFTGEGFINGIKETKSGVEKVASEVSGVSIDAMKEAIAQSQDLVYGDIGAQPTIKPVIDLTEVQRGAAAMRGILSTKPIQATGDYAQAVSLSGDISAARRVISERDAGNSNTGGVTYIQNNTSPKALSEADIYRQTKNQLSTIKQNLEG